jgi:Domain of unknown function (DUF3387)
VSNECADAGIHGEQADAAKETTEDGKKRAQRRYAAALSTAFALAAASDEARKIREEVGFFQAIRAALAKSVPGATAKQHHDAISHAAHRRYGLVLQKIEKRGKERKTGN